MRLFQYGVKMNKYEVEKTMSGGSADEQVVLLSQLTCIFESYDKNIKDFDEITQTLVNLSVKISDDNVLDQILETIVTAQINQNIDNINFDIIDEYLADAKERFLARFIDIISYTYNRKYLPSILRFKDNSNIYVRQAVEDAIVELGIGSEDIPKYSVEVVRMNSDFEEEIIVKVEGIELLCFVSDWGTDIEVGKFYSASIGVLILDDLEINESFDERSGLEQIDDSFAHNIYGKFNFNSRTIAAGISVVFDKDEVDLFDYAYLDGKYVCARVDRITLAFNAF